MSEPQKCPLCGFDPPTFKDTGDAMCFTHLCPLSGMTFTTDEWATLTKKNWQEVASVRKALLPPYRSRGRR